MQDYAKAILANATNNNLAPTTSPIVTDPSRLAAISGANASKFAANLIGGTSAALAGTAGNQADLNANAIKGEIEASKQRQSQLQDMVDPSKYQQVENSAGGYDFLDPQGNKITVQQYAKINGTNPAAVLAKSTDPGDVQFRNDYNNLQDLITAVANKDKTKLNEYYKNQPELKNMTPGALISQFKQYYSGYFGGPSTSNAGQLYTSLDAAAGNNSTSDNTGFN